LEEKPKILLLGDINSSHLKKWIHALALDYRLGVFSFNSINESSKSELNDLNVSLYCNTNKTKLSKLSYFLQFSKLKTAVKEFQPDIIHAHYATSYGFFGARLKNNNFIVSAWGSDIFEFPKKSFLHRAFIKYVLSKASLLMSTSRVMAREMDLYTNKKIVITPFGISTDLFKPVVRPETDCFVIGTVKGLEDVYGIDLLISAFKLFHDKYPNSECHIYGKGSQKLKYVELVDSLELDSVIKFKGYVKNDIVPKALNSFDVFCALSRAESFGVAVLEASSCSIPVVVNDISGLKEVVLNGETGFTVNAYKPDQVAEKLFYLANNKDKCSQMGRKGREWVINNYRWTDSVKIMKAQYEKILSEN